MNVIRFLCLFLLFLFTLGCKDCQRLNFEKSEKEWVSHFRIGQKYFFKSYDKPQIDTLEIIDIASSYTPCNRIELSNFQSETFVVRGVFKSRNDYNGKGFLISMTKSQQTLIEPEIVVAGLGTKLNSLQRKMISISDTIIGDVKYKSVLRFSKGNNAEQYGLSDFIVNFYWDKNHGLIAYTTKDKNHFVWVNTGGK